MTGKLIIIKPEVLAPEYRRSEHQIKRATGGFGCSPNSRGNAVFCKDLYSGKESRFERHDVLGVADVEKLPEWAKAKLDEQQQSKEPSPKQPKTLKDKLEAARIKADQENAARKAERGDKSKKNNEERE